nr:unnamed protein product [Spodoptera littoralis]
MPSFLSANAKCWWAGALAAATAELRYAGYVSPGVLLVAGAPRALETVRGAYARSVETAAHLPHMWTRCTIASTKL